MPSLTIQRTVNAPAQRAFAHFSDLANVPAMIPAIKKLEILTPGPVGKGTRFRETRIMFGKEATETMEITAFEPPRSYTVEGHSCGSLYATTFSFEPAGSAATLVTMHFSCHAQTLTAKLMIPLSFLLMGVMRKALESDMDAMKAAAERAG
ncbi:MAG: SRPBCC family protein [Phycisphaerales bacterium]